MSENSETYRTRLWVINDEGTYRFILDQIRSDGDTLDVGDMLDNVAYVLQEMWEDSVDDAVSSAPAHVREMCDVFLRAIDWRSIAEHYLDHIEEQVAQNVQDEENSRD